MGLLYTCTYYGEVSSHEKYHNDMFKKKDQRRWLRTKKLYIIPVTTPTPPQAKRVAPKYLLDQHPARPAAQPAIARGYVQ